MPASFVPLTFRGIVFFCSWVVKIKLAVSVWVVDDRLDNGWCCAANWRQLEDRPVRHAAHSVSQWGKQGCLLSAVWRPEDCERPPRQHDQGGLLLCLDLLTFHWELVPNSCSDCLEVEILKYPERGSHASWKVLDFPGPGKSWKISLVLESPGNESLRSWKVLENEDPGKLTNSLGVQNKQRVALA